VERGWVMVQAHAVVVGVPVNLQPSWAAAGLSAAVGSGIHVAVYVAGLAGEEWTRGATASVHGSQACACTVTSACFCEAPILLGGSWPLVLLLALVSTRLVT
jgi:hypothetical protein